MRSLVAVLVVAGCGAAVTSRPELGAVEPPPVTTGPEPTLVRATTESETIADDETPASFSWTTVDPDAVTGPMDALRSWLDASSGASFARWNDGLVEAWAGRWTDHTELCVADAGCWSITPTPATIDVLGRPDDDADGWSEVLVRLDRATFAVRAGELVPERVHLRDGERWRTEHPERGADELAIAPITWSGPGAAAMELHPESLDDATVVTDDGFCRRFEAGWACAQRDGIVEVEVDRVERIVAGTVDDEIWVESETSDGGSEEWDCFTTVHLFVREHDRLIERASIAVGADLEVRSSEAILGAGGEPTDWSSMGAGEALTWSWSVAGPGCVSIGEAAVARRRWYDGDHRVRRSRPRARYGAAVDRLPRFVGERDLAGGPEHLHRDLDADMLAGPTRPPPTLEDRRGTFRLEEGGWARTEACGA